MMKRSFLHLGKGISYDLEDVMDEIVFLHYGTTLQHDRIHKLMRSLKPFEEWKNPNLKDHIRLSIHFFDFNERMGNTVYNPYTYYLLTNEQFKAFERKFKRLYGYHERVHPEKAWGHCIVQINNKEYSTRVYQTLDKMNLFFIDDESEYNKEIRSKVYYLPENLKFLAIESDKVKTYENAQKYVKTWIEKVLNYNINK